MSKLRVVISIPSMSRDQLEKFKEEVEMCMSNPSASLITHIPIEIERLMLADDTDLLLIREIQ